MALPWEYWPIFETEDEHRLFWRWVHLGADHSATRRLASRERRPYREIDDLRSAKMWPDRFAAWDNHVTEGWRAGIESAAAKHSETVEALQRALAHAAEFSAVELADLASAALRTGKGGMMKPAEAIKGLGILADVLAKLAPPPGASVTSGASVDVSRLSVEEQLELRRLTGKIRGE